MGYCTNAEVLKLLQSQNIIVDTSTVAITAQNVLDENHYTTNDISLVNTELLIDNAINFVNLQANTSISGMNGTPGSKSAIATRTQSIIIKTLTVLLIRAYKDRGPQVGVGGLSVTSVITDPQYTLFNQMMQNSIPQLRVTTDYLEIIDHAIEHAGMAIDNYCLRPNGYFESGGILITEFLNGKDVSFGFPIGGATMWSFGTYVTAPYGVLKFKQKPVVQCVTLYEYVSGSWVLRGLNYGFQQILPGIFEFETGFERVINDYYETIEEGIHFKKTLPSQTYNNLRATYLAGYDETPAAVRGVCILLAAQIMLAIMANTMLLSKQLVLPEPVLTEQMKDRLRSYMRIVAPKLV